jgi:alanine transaminase
MTIQLKDIGKAVLGTEYAVRGPIVERAQELEREGREIIYCNIGNPQALEQKPLTYVRQVLALCQYPDLIERAAALFPPDVLETARRRTRRARGCDSFGRRWPTSSASATASPPIPSRSS